MHTLYYAPGAANMLVHWLSIKLDLPHELRLIDTSIGQQKRPEYLTINPKGVVPTLMIYGTARYERQLCRCIWPTASACRSRARVRRYSAHGLLPMVLHLADAVQPLFRQGWCPHERAGEAQAEAVRHGDGARRSLAGWY